MITDAQLWLADSVALGTVITGTGDEDLSQVTNGHSYDRGPLHADNLTIASMGEGETLYFFWMIRTGATAGGTINLKLVSDEGDPASAGLDSNSIVHAQSGALAIATAAGTFGFEPLAPRGITAAGVPAEWKRYIGILATVATADVTGTATLHAGITADVQYIKQYASGLNFV